ncbi:peptide-methionine (S)-S-oxide reductase [Candidatus Gottesmanbacteria bacterium RIFCSPHIGHO2_01_FULL_39_10]|uniref:Peptide methionine sulfoxide reductase MsrA n=1 Tax=Candidatus Gottesmanbacteria bacterium RIFCSPHIGHO2_01_FULL_39_10 TaxID=1798375 RepID=A0A1F5ZN28_9BACT|nr:MAG: peptide-methionine (S)-S-oxide reductase [Candidatus Gottesmanbacteria bacterium RIFCSPHIGHO2_01_FULL_39_10]
MEKLENAYFAGGCFWCTEAVFRRLEGVKEVVTGFAGGDKENPTYEEVVSGTTGHAEAIKIVFDPSIISYETLLEVFWAVHNPTTLNKQDYDVGREYRSAIFYADDVQKEKALASKKELEEKKVYQDPIVTEISALGAFYTAEEYHQNFYDKNKMSPYCLYIIDPKIEKLLEKFGSKVKKEYRR